MVHIHRIMTYTQNYLFKSCGSCSEIYNLEYGRKIASLQGAGKCPRGQSQTVADTYLDKDNLWIKNIWDIYMKVCLARVPHARQGSQQGGDGT